MTIEWRKSSYSGHDTDCIEVARLDVRTTAVRDTKNRSHGAFALPSTSWIALIEAVKNE
ncbi:DUF397 domain-containing protein [Streptomyces sp. SID3343]|uniref:DUF397 domain-containing protein n=1 Tax=Streptomyces sp. SID3343 TaxID=2690260 RepID=UPI001367C37A|nr:DUF397 domain-containing protein [Streptomyces sp. SID3343]MYV98534.1 DUF397 domain-containing protein [Streptomyces sp. SID3343]